ncbi:hypothetical protein NQ314_001402 [Rhamnusium bicolor]|uniref:FERM domain-containing protein n=1 Tax=Rhamnusium bicolor TaxID=1586634 RepID=A0AAV8ZU75_9CUCU|nr:hypothetical protein NQ314_001402 [Rhamnusium bicolor]
MECFCSKVYSVHCKIVFLDESELVHELQNNSNGQALLDVVFRHLNLLETAYFGLRYLDQNGQTHWLDPTKKLNKQIKGPDPYTLYFGVKFYAADPYILQGRLLVPFELSAELGAYILQSELGDFDPRRHSIGYVSEFRFLPNQSVELEMRMAELHQTLIGQLPSQAELNYLDKVKWLENYGVDLHPVLGEDHVEYFLGLTPSGIIVLRNKNTVGNYYWPRITKIYFKGRYFMLRVTDKNNDECTYGFETPSKSACKHLWKCCVEHHAFFRLVQVSPTSPDIFALGSRFRYSGRTEKQAPSRKYSRRLNLTNNEPAEINATVQQSQFHIQEIKHISLPLPAENFEGSYNVGSISRASNTKKIDSPHSTRSAPWSQPHAKGLYNSSAPPSPRSVRSGRYRSSSIDSQSSNDSRSCKKEDIEVGLQTTRVNCPRVLRDLEENIGGENQEVKRIPSQSMTLSLLIVDPWQEIQKNIARDSNSNTIQQANVISSRKSNERRPESTDYNSTGRRNKHRKHRSRSRSPAESKPWLSTELKKHLEFDLVDTCGMSDLQLKEIPYTVVQTNYSKHVKLKHSNSTKSDDKSRTSTLSSYSHQSHHYNDKNPSYGHHTLLNEALSNFSYPDHDSNSNSIIGLPEPLQPSGYYGGYNNSVQDNFPNFSRVHHEHSDSGLGVDQDCDGKRLPQNKIN